MQLLEAIKTNITNIRNTAKRLWPFGEPLPDGIIVEGTGTLQCVCPTCDYHSNGRKDNFIAVAAVEQVVTCPNCDTTYKALTLGDPR